MTKTALFARNQPGGVFDYVSIFNVQGDAWFVDSGATGASDSAGYGHNPDAPFATLDYAMDATNGVTANNGDVVFLMPGHAETLGASNRPALDRAGVRVIGLGIGADRPTFTASVQADCITLSGASVSLENVLITCTGTVDFTKAISVTAADCTIKDVEVRCSAATSEFAAGIVCSNAADRLTVDGYRFYGVRTGDAQATAIYLEGDDGVRIRNCSIYGNHATACIEIKTTACLDLQIDHCDFYNAGSSALSLLIVNTGGTSSYWEARDCFDMTSGAFFCGGSGAALASSSDASVGTAVGSVGTIVGSVGTIVGSVGTIVDSVGTKVGVVSTSVLSTATTTSTMVASTAAQLSTAAVSTTTSVGTAVGSVGTVAGSVGTQVGVVSTAISTLTVNTSGAWQFARSDWTFATDGGTAGAFNIFTVTGTVLARIFGYVGATCSDSTNNGTGEVGIAGNTAAIIAQTDSDLLVQYASWQDNSPEANPGPVDITGRTFVIGNGADVIFTIAGEDLTGGTINFYCLWLPLSAGATVVAA